MHQCALADSGVLLQELQPLNDGTSGAWKGEDEFLKPGIIWSCLQGRGVRVMLGPGSVSSHVRNLCSAGGDLDTGGTLLMGVNLMAFSLQQRVTVRLGE